MGESIFELYDLKKRSLIRRRRVQYFFY